MCWLGLACAVQVDVQALAAQVQAKRRAKEQEKAEEQEYAQTLATHVGMLTMSQLGAAERRKEWNKEVAELRNTCQVQQQQAHVRLTCVGITPQ